MLGDAKYAVKHSSIADQNHFFTAYMSSDKPNKFMLFLLMVPMNAILTTNEVEPTIESYSGVHDQGYMPSSLLDDEE